MRQSVIGRTIDIRFVLLLFFTVLVLAGCGESRGGTSAGPVAMRGSTAASNGSDSQSEEEVYTDPVFGNTEGMLVLVVRLDTKDEHISVMDVNTNRQVRYEYDLSTSFINEWGDPCSQSEFMPGTMAVLGKVNSENVLQSITEYDGAWTVDSLTNYKVNLDREQFLIGRTKYRLRPSTLVFSGDLEVTVADIGEDDVLRVVGVDREIKSVSITTGHGYLKLVDTDRFNDSLAQVGSDIFVMIHGDTNIEVPEGKQMLTVAKDGWGGSKEIKVKRNTTVTVSLEAMKGNGPKYCTIKFKIDVAGATVTLDGKRVKKNKAKVVYGKHQLKVEADGYETWEKTIFANSPSAEIELTLSAEEKSSASGGSKNNAGTNSSTRTGSSSGNNGNANSTNSNNGNANSTTNNGDTSGGSGSSTPKDTSDSADSKREAELDYLTTLSDILKDLSKSD